ncbi:MAG: hypothetical protein HKN89_02850 [Eudoraea sp.]|nr:hypothetical protein [Eudoraea sp.]
MTRVLKTNKQLLVKSLTYLVYTLFLMFLAPVVLFQAFKNQEQALYPYVLQIGLVLVVLAIVMGFYSIYVMMLAIFGAKK